MEQHGGGRRRPLVVLASSPFHGHMTPTLQLATTLHAKGFPIAIAHSKSSNPPNPSTHPSDFTFLPLSGTFPAVEQSGSIANFISMFNNSCRASFKEHLTRLISSEGRKAIVVIYDNVMYFAGVVAVEMKVAAIVFRSTSAGYFPAFVARLQLTQQSRFLEHDFVMQEVVPNHYPIRYKDLPFAKSPIEDWREIVAMFGQQACSAVILNTVKSLEQDSLTRIHNHLKVPVFAVGPLHKISPDPSGGFHQGDTSCIAWLDKQPPKSVIYISFGSLATMDSEVLTEMAWGLAKSNQRFLWAVRPGLVNGSEWLESLPDGFIEETRERGLIVKWAPQKEVLAHFAVGGFWSHCGWNSCLESISSGVVMICQPLGIDQGVNARYVSSVWKVGVELERVERGEIERVIRRVMVADEGEEMRVRVNDMKEMVTKAVGDGGSSQESLEGLVDFILSNS